MRAATVLLSVLGSLKGKIHARRLWAVCQAAEALVGGRATVTGIGRALRRTARTKHLIKAADRLVGNVLLHGELLRFYAALCGNILKSNERPVLLIDWTDIGTRWAALVFTLVSDGRGIVVYSRAVPRRFENSPKVEREGLRQVGKLLGPLSPIVVGDAGFRGPWMKTVLAAKGWDFVVRVRGRVQARQVGGTGWCKLKTLWAQATARPKCLGEMDLVRFRPVRARLVLVHKRRHSTKKLPNIGRRKKRHVRSAREPWVLATSLKSATAKEVVALYATRMRIELTFRDQKCARFGWGLDQSRSRSVGRVNVLLMLAALAHYLAMTTGAAVERAKLHRAFQANTVMTRRVLSLPRLAREALNTLSGKDVRALLRALTSPQVLTSGCT